EEAKAYRLWERKTKTIEKHKDVRFLEDETPCTQEGEGATLCEMPLDISAVEDERQTPAEAEQTAIEPEVNIHQAESISESEPEEET
ncbi:hypothetical protein KPH14_001338, partial [Odynerus spinipes]